MKLTVEEIQQKLGNLKTMDDVTEFMKTVAATAVAKVSEEQANEPSPVKDNKEFAFTRLISCGFCGSGVTACEKYKNQQNGNVHRYVYYRCALVRNRTSIFSFGGRCPIR
jgi:hypothetical protein